MRTLRPGDKGEEVQTLLTILKQQGFYPYEVGMTYGARAHKAVTYFQETHLGPEGEFLDTDGIVGKNTWWALENPSGDAQRSYIPGRIPDALTSLRNRQLEIALREHARGVQEVPDGSNWSEDLGRYGVPRSGAAWCCFFWSWCNKENFGEYSLKNLQFRGHCLSTWRKAEEQGMAFPKENYNPIPGDAFIMLYRDQAGKLIGTGHIGFVLRVEFSGGRATAINTVEGNAGNRVKVGKRVLASHDMVGFINNFPPEEQPQNWEKGLVTARSSEQDTTR